MAVTSTVGHLMWRVSMKWRAAVDAAVIDFGLTQAQYAVLASLRGMTSAGGTPSQRELADFTGLDPIYVSKLARMLEGAGLLSRVPDAHDSRAVQLALTPRGIDVVDRAVLLVRDLLDELTAPLGGTDSEQTRNLVSDLEALLGIPTTDESPSSHDERNEMSTATLLTSRDIGVAENTLRSLLTTKLLKGTGLGYHEWVAFNLIAVQPPGSAERLTAQMRAGLKIEQDAAVAVVADLASRGLITIDGDQLTPTPDGSDLYARLAPQIQANTKSIYAGIDEAELATAYRVLSTLTERANAILAAA